MFDEALAVVSEAIRSGRSSGSAAATHHDAGAIDVNGFIDFFEVESGMISIGGWMLVDNAIPGNVSALDADGNTLEMHVVERPDIAKAFPTVDNALNAGFQIRLSTGLKPESGSVPLTLVVSSAGSEKFHCQISVEDLEREFLGPYSLGDGIAFIP